MYECVHITVCYKLQWDGINDEYICIIIMAYSIKRCCTTPNSHDIGSGGSGKVKITNSLALQSLQTLFTKIDTTMYGSVFISVSALLSQ